MWDPVVATLPDLSIMHSKTYINEVDVRRVKSGQKVEIGLDAFPEKRLSGIITRVANVGEQSPNADAKVFEATIEIAGTDPLLRPSMTTSNKIIVNQVDSVIFVPLECLHSKDDSITFVYKRAGIKAVKQEVQIGETNSNEAIIAMGLASGDKVYLSIPSGTADAAIAMLPELDGKRQKKEESQSVEAPKTMTITLPDGTTREVTPEQMQRFRNPQGQGGQARQGNAGGNTSRPQ